MTATQAQVDLIERVIRTHRAGLADVIRTVGPFPSLSRDEADKVLCGLADGEFGGISSPQRDNRKITPGQTAQIYRLAWEVWGRNVMRQALIFARRIYPRTDLIASLTCRQAARVIVELDRLKEGRQRDVEGTGKADGQEGREIRGERGGKGAGEEDRETDHATEAEVT